MMNLKKQYSTEYVINSNNIVDVTFEAVKLNLLDHVIAILFSGRIDPNVQRYRHNLLSFSKMLGREEITNFLDQSLDHISRLFERYTPK